MQDHHSLDEIRQQLQESLAQSKRDRLREQHGMKFEHTDSRLSPEAENEWLDHLLEFERQFEKNETITVRERIGNPHIQPITEIPLYALEEAVEKLLELLAESGIVIDFMGEWDDLAAYQFIIEEMLDEEMDDIRIEGMFTHFEATTPAYDVQMWVDIFVGDIFWQDREDFLQGLEKQPFFDAAGEPMTAAEFGQKVQAVWAQMPARTRVDVSPITTQVAKNEGEVTAVITWHIGDEKKQVESFFRLQPSPYFGWAVVQTTLLDDLLAL